MTGKTGKFVTVVGPTASGKSDLAMRLASVYGGEIICADSRTVFRGMDLGTAKPSPTDQARVPHHLLDIIEPDERLSAAAYKVLAQSAVQEITGRDKLPFLVGGSGLYVDAVVFDYHFPPAADVSLRRELEALNDHELLERLSTTDPAAFATVDRSNRRRVIRAIEIAGQTTTRRNEPVPETVLIGLGLNKNNVQQRMVQRIEKTLDEGIIDEVKRVGQAYGWESEAMSGNAYRAFKDVARGYKTIEQGKADNLRADLSLYKKQLTWFKRNPAINWLEDPAEADVIVTDFLRRTV